MKSSGILWGLERRLFGTVIEMRAGIIDLGALVELGKLMRSSSQWATVFPWNSRTLALSTSSEKARRQRQL